MRNFINNFIVLSILMVVCQFSDAAALLLPSETAQIEASVKQLYSLRYVDATCLFGKVDDAGQLVDPRVRNRSVREREYERFFKPLLSSGLYAEMKGGCVSPAGNGMLDLRINDDSIANDPKSANNVIVKITKPIRVEPRSEGIARAIVYWSEFLGITAKKAATSGRTDLIFVREGGRWLINDAIIAAFDPNLPDDSHAVQDLMNKSANEFEANPDGVSIIDYRKLPLSCSKTHECK